MKYIFMRLWPFLLVLILYQTLFAEPEPVGKYPVARPGTLLKYACGGKNLPVSVLKNFTLTAGNIEVLNGVPYQWICLEGRKVNGQNFSVWILTSEYPPETSEKAEEVVYSYILIKSGSDPVKYLDRFRTTAVLPNTGAWKYLLPRSANHTNPFSTKEQKIRLLGLKYTFEGKKLISPPTPPGKPHKIVLTPDLLIGIPHNTKMKYGIRKYDDSEYEYVLMTKDDYYEMIKAGLNCFYVSPREKEWVENENVYYWGVGGKNVSYPECLYQSNYIGPVIFFDEPMVGTRDHVIRPKLREDPGFRKTITPQIAFDEFKKVFHKKKYEEGPTRLIKELNARKDVDTGDMDFLQQNVYSWETMVSSAAYQLSEGNRTPPDAMVFEPPGRFGTRRVLPELNMCFDCQIPADDSNNLIGIIYGFLRGAARATQKTWGMSIYGQVDRSDAYWFMTHAYDLGATRFFFWDNHRLAAVPYSEYISLSKNLREHAANFPNRNLSKLTASAEVAILIPPYYNLGHVKMGLGSITGLPELNLERKNACGIKYRTVMSNFLTEVERCIRLGIEYDLFWNLENLDLKGYREIVSIREDGKVAVTENGETNLFNAARKPERPQGRPPTVTVKVQKGGNSLPATITAIAHVTEGSAPVYYTMGADSSGIYINQYVLWELFGPEKEDYTDLWNDRWAVSIVENDHSATAEIHFKIDNPGNYRLRVASTDLAGRSAVVWQDIHIGK